MLESAQALVDEYADLERQLADPALHSGGGDSGKVSALTKRYAALAPTVAAYQAVVTAREDLAAARELGTEDESFAQEVPSLEATVEAAEETLRRRLIPRDPDDERDVILEVKAGEGGEESALFAGDLLRMYARYAEKRGWRAEVIDATESDLGGYKDARLSIRARKASPPGEAPWALLKFEGGVHRVQRVPVTESQGRIHTSAAGVLVMPEVEEAEDARPEDRRLPQLRPRGPERQHDRLGRPDHPPADRCRRLLPEREVAAAEQGVRAARPACAPAHHRPGADGGAGLRGPPQPGPHGRP